jgi:hypothetical protein
LFSLDRVLTQIAIGQVCLGQCSTSRNDIKLRTLIKNPDKTVVTDDISLSRCEFYRVKALRDCFYVAMSDPIFWSFPCNVRRIGCVFHLMHCKLTLTIGFAPAVCDVVPTEPSLAD